MAMNDAEKGEALFFLGYSARTLVPDTTDYSPRVAEKFTRIPDHFEVRIRKTLQRIRDIDNKLDEATARYSVTEIEGVKLNAQESSMLRSERRRLQLQLSNLLDLPVCRSGSSMIGVGI